nr:MAG TPA: hypothetical protein [Caudoviricetes sp.]
MVSLSNYGVQTSGLTLRCSHHHIIAPIQASTPGCILGKRPRL